MSEMKKLIESLDKLQECPPEMGEGGMMPPAPMDQGSPVSVNVSMNASGKEHVEDLLRMMQQAGLGAAKEVEPEMMPMRTDMERLRSIVDKGDMESDESYAEVITDDEAIEEGGMSDIHAQISSADDPEQMVMDLIKKGGPVGDYLYGELEQLATEKGLTFNDGETDPAELVPELLANMGIEEAYDNEPDYEYSDHEKMTHDLSGGINREKKAYKAAQRGDNAMAAESIRKELYKALAEKKAKKDYDGDGKIESPKDEYMGSKDKAIKKAMSKKK